MKKQYLAICLTILTLFLAGCTDIRISKTIEEAMQNNNIQYLQIAHIEDLKDGTIVIYAPAVTERLGFAYLKKHLQGWSFVDKIEKELGQHFDDSDKEGMSWEEDCQLEKIVGSETFIPIFWGIITNPDIMQVRVKSHMGTIFSPETEYSLEAKIVSFSPESKSGIRTWFLIQSNETVLKLGEGPFEVLGVSGQGEILYNNWKTKQ